MKTASTIAILLLVVSVVTGCAGTKDQSDAAASVNLTPEVSAANVPEPAIAPNKNDLPNVALTDEILFKVLSAEIAFQRADYPAAIATMMAVAQQTRDPRLAKRTMEIALLSKQSAQAYLAAKMWFQYAPHSDEAAQYYLGFMIINNDLKEVNSVVGPRLSAADRGQRGMIMLETQRLLARSNDKEMVFKILESLFKPYPDLIESHLAIAQAAFAINNTKRAVAEANEALKIDPASPLAALTLAQVSKPQDALKILEDYLTRYPAANDVRRAYAGILVEQKNYVEARNQFELISAAKPDESANLYALGVLSLELKDTSKAETYFKRFVNMVEASPNEKRDPTSAYLYLSQIADDRKEGEAAIGWLKKIQSFDGKNTAYFNAQLRQALLIVKYGSLDDARKFLHGLRANSQEQVQIAQLDAELLRNANRDAEAFTVLQATLKQRPDNADLLYDFAMTAEKLNRYDDMEKALQRVIKINPQNAQAYNSLGYSLADRNIRLAEARTYIDKAFSIAPEDPFILDSMGWLAHRERRDEAALGYLQRAYQIRPEIDIAVHIGEVFWEMGEQQKAKTIWKEASQKDPQNSSLQNALKRLKVNF